MIAAERRVQFFTDAEIQLDGGPTLFWEGRVLGQRGDGPGRQHAAVPWQRRANQRVLRARPAIPSTSGPIRTATAFSRTSRPPTGFPANTRRVPLGYFGRPLGAEAAGENSGDELRKFDNLRAMIGFESELPGGWTLEGHLARARAPTFRWTPSATG